MFNNFFLTTINICVTFIRLFQYLYCRQYNKFITLFIVFLPLQNLSAIEVLSDYSNKDNWRLIAGKGEWQNDPETGEMCLTVTGGSGIIESNYWTLNYPFQPNKQYKLSCQVRKSSGSSGGLILIGSNIVNKDVNAEKSWTTYEFYFSTPSDVSHSYLRFGQWKVNGTIWFRNIQISPVQPFYKTVNGIQLGEGETIKNGIYQAHYNFRNFHTNSSRSLLSFNCYFNTNRWDFNFGSFLVFKHLLGHYDIRQKSGQVTLDIGYYTGGKCIIEASRDGKYWLEAGTINKTGHFSFSVPLNLYPAEIIYIRMKSFGLTPRFQINNYQYTAEIPGNVQDLSGRTDYAEILEASKDFDVYIESLFTDGNQKTIINITNNTNKLRYFNIEKGKNGQFLQNNIAAPPGKTMSVEYPANKQEPNESLIIFPVDNEFSKYTANLKFTTRYIEKTDYGYLIDKNDDATVWWTDATRKIGKDRFAPQELKSTIEFYCARNEYEPMQLVIRANREMENVTAKLSQLTHQNGTRLPLQSAKLMLVDYVYIQSPTDAVGSMDYWPDPLPPLKKPFSIKKGENQPLWLLIKVAKNALPGNYSGYIRLKCGKWLQEIPIRLHVWDFALPEETHLQTAFGFQASFLNKYHHFSSSDNLTSLLDKYFKNFAEHRISPYDPFVLGNIKMSVDPDSLNARLDFSRFDALGQKYLNQMKFNSFKLKVQGLGYGSFHGRQYGQIGSFKQGSPEYEKIMTDYLSKVQDYLEKRGWLDKAYIYWFDEPEPKDYDFIKETMGFIQKAAPKLTRMLTEQPEQELEDYVDLWCPKTDNYDHDMAQLCHSRGEKLWWYICTSPKEPFCALFIDHYAVELRTWIWQSWKYGLDGILVWATNYWTSEVAFPGTEVQNPYQDPMSYKRGYGLKSGEKVGWGNGDGRFIYPPKSVFESKQKNMDEPVSSIRWEILREGLEDYEYFWLLNDLINKLNTTRGDTLLLKQAKKLLIVPETITSSLTNFSKNPDFIYEHRTKLAEMIERLRKEL